ncbi:sterol O-acyltransferase 2 isoform X3 [Python bivittatus]|uniref:O-acyltransferase n=1 Tax=Python bivittatus TaxID=176946 RepID=A0A9F5ISA8_PYTBI|nr:sterol O-acyltransferase 2 isoform X3 [Python bivittatus]
MARTWMRRTTMDPREMGTGDVRQRSSQKQAEEEPQVLNREIEHLDSIIAHIQWKKHLEVMKAEVLEQVHNQLSDLLGEALEDAAHSFPQHLNVGPAKKQSREKDQLLKEKKKVFVCQRSLFDIMMEMEHFRSIYHIFLAMLCLFATTKIIVDSIDEGRLVLDFKLITFAFAQPQMTIFAWLCMFLYTLSVPYQALQIWSGSLKTARFPVLFTVTLVVLLLLCHMAFLGFYPIYVVTHFNLGPASCCIVTIEQFRFLMKSYSFLRESVPPLLHARDQKGKISPPEFSTYLYYLFCPTLIYRESYPREPYIRWSYVIQSLAKFLVGIYYMSLILEHVCLSDLRIMHKQPFSIKTMVLSIFHGTIAGTFIILVFYYCYQHCWLNMFAEMLRFADRGFYKDWWNSTSFPEYYRSWNLIVHEWLYYYIQQDFLWLTGGKARSAAKLTVFIVSAVVHEYALSLSVGFFYPILFILFAVFGVIFHFTINNKRKSPVCNFIIWTAVCLGYGFLFSLYPQEFYARIHCPLKEETFWGLVIPRSWSCYA